jgi:flagellar biosynthesis protein FlhG
MNDEMKKGKIIKFNKKSNIENEINDKFERRVISISSGKGGVGKTNIVANLGYAFCKLGKKVLIVDADFGLGNIDVLLGLTPKYNLLHVITGEKNLEEITIEGPGEMVILPASSGIDELTNLDKEQRYKILSELEKQTKNFDIILIDTAAGISKNVTYFNAASQETIIIVSPEPTSITDAYALMKVLSLKYNQKNFSLLVNMADNTSEGKKVYNQLKMVSDRFLEIHINYIGSVTSETSVIKCVKSQKLFTEIYPETSSSKNVEKIAKHILKNIPKEIPSGNNNFFWDKVVDNFDK